MRAFVVIATRGRAAEVRKLLDHLQRQSLPPVFTVIIASEASDVEGVSSHPLIAAGRGEAIISDQKGLTAQRNRGLDYLERSGYFTPPTGRFFCAFFDDDYRPADDWLHCAARRFSIGDIAGLTGRLLADGVKTGGLSEEKAAALIAIPILSATREYEPASLYGCNMAFADRVARANRFDENLPLYGWLEDLDYTAMAKKSGRIVHCPDCRGVHLGIPGGRGEGMTFGYAQIANPLYLMRKGTMAMAKTAYFITRALAANILRGLSRKPDALVDYRGRLSGNLRALSDSLRLRCHPRNIVE